MFHEVHTYAPDEVYLTFGGYIVEGWNSITLSKQVPTFTTIQGVRGKNTRVRNKNSHSNITVSCDMTSEVNAILSSIVSIDRSTGGACLNLSLIDGSGQEVFSSNEAYVQDDADRTYDNTISERVWTIECLTSRWSDRGDVRNNLSIFERLFR